MIRTLVVGLAGTAAGIYIGNQYDLTQYGLPKPAFPLQKQQIASIPSKPRSAVCILREDGQSGVSGTVYFHQQSPNDPTRVTAQIKGLKQGKHGFHVHQYGDLTKGCTTAGPHFNPAGKNHGAPTSTERHVGDLGNVEADAKGDATYEWTDNQVKLSGPLSVLGRSIVVHADPDDLGLGGHNDSLTTGHAGARVACGVIALSKED